MSSLHSFFSSLSRGLVWVSDARPRAAKWTRGKAWEGPLSDVLKGGERLKRLPQRDLLPPGRHGCLPTDPHTQPTRNPEAP